MTDADDLPVHRVAITVFATVEAVDERDAGHIAEQAVRQAIHAQSDDYRAPVLEIRFYGADPEPEIVRRVRVTEVMETGMAAGNGYLWLRPTAKSFKESGGIT